MPSILYATLARFDTTLPLPFGRDGRRAGTTDEWIDWLASEWGKGEVYQLFMSSPPDAAAVKRVLARYEREAVGAAAVGAGTRGALVGPSRHRPLEGS